MQEPSPQIFIRRYSLPGYFLLGWLPPLSEYFQDPSEFNSQLHPIDARVTVSRRRPSILSPKWISYESMDDFITINFGVKTTTKRRRAMYRKISKCLSKKSNEAYKFYLREGGEQGEEDDSDDDSDDDL